MLTLDTLQRMADRMPGEPAGDAGAAPFRRPDAELRTREVQLPSVRDEARRAGSLFAFLVIVSLTVSVPVGVLVTHLADFWAGHFEAARVLHTALWFGGWTLLFIVPFAGFGLIRELYRYRDARARLGDRATLASNGLLRSQDGLRTYPLSARDRD